MMRIRSIELTDFRGIAHLELQLPDHPPLLVLLGENGSGKSSVLDALAMALGKVVLVSEARPEGPPARELAETDIKVGRARASFVVSVEALGETVGWRCWRERDGARGWGGEGATGALHLAIRRAETDGDAAVPTVALYRTNRGVHQVDVETRNRNLFGPLAAYHHALASAPTDFGMFFEWFRDREDLENEQRLDRDAEHRDAQLEAVRAALAEVMGPDYERPRVRRRQPRLLVDKFGEELALTQLSDGEKCLLAMVGDIARRLAMGNSGGEEPRNGDGVVLIDEIDLHLHPRWQRMVVPALRRAFPNVQFILTTQSPQVAASVPAHCIRILRQTRNGIEAVEPEVSEGLDTNSILTILMETTDRPEDVSRQLEELFDLISQREWARAEAALDGVREIPGAESEALKAETLIRLGRKLAAR